MNSTIEHLFGNKIRIRVCGVCVVDGKLLLIKHQGVGALGTLWAPPGGGIEFGETIEECLKREFFEETGYNIIVGDFLFYNEFIQSPLHAIELFFSTTIINGEMQQGIDPEMSLDKQIILDISFFSRKMILDTDPALLHKKIPDLLEYL